MAKGEHYIDPHQTKRSTYELSDLPKTVQCKGCGRSLEKGTPALWKRYNNTPHIILACCNESCLEEYDHKFWQTQATKNQGNYRPSITALELRFENRLHGEAPEIRYKEDF